MSVRGRRAGGGSWLLLAVIPVAAPLAAQTAGRRLSAAARRAARRQLLSTRRRSPNVCSPAGHPAALPALTALLEDRLYVRQPDRRRRHRDDRRTRACPRCELDRSRELSSRPASAPPAELTKIGTNNRLRRFLRTTLARFALANPDAVGPARRRHGDAALARRRDRRAAAAARGCGNRRRRQVRDRHRPGARGARRHRPRRPARRDRDARRPPRAPTSATAWPACVEHARRRAVRRAGRRRAARRGRRGARASTRRAASTRRIETLFFGLSLGSVLVLVAIGLAITFGVMGVINMAHGELMMLGAYTTYVVQALMPAPPRRVDSWSPSRRRSSSRRWPA